MCLNHPKTIPLHPWSMEKLSSMKPVLGDEKVEDCCCKGIYTIPQDTHVSCAEQCRRRLGNHSNKAVTLNRLS